MSTLAERFNKALSADNTSAGDQLRELERRSSTDPQLHTAVRSPLLLRPMFLGAREKAALESDLAGLTQLMRAVPQRLFDGDVSRMCDVLGFSPWQRSAVEATWQDGDVVLSRADIMRGAEGFKVIEHNLHSSLGGIDCGPWHRAFLAMPFFADLAAAEQLGYVDPLDGIAGALRSASRGRGLGLFPSVALVDWPASYPQLAPRLGRVAKLLQARGFDAFACHAGQLSEQAGKLFAGTRRIDVLYRIFVIEDVPNDPSLLTPILAAHRAGNLVLAMSFLAELVGNKGCLALLSDPTRSPDLDSSERTLVERVVPWTRLLDRDRFLWRGAEMDLTTLSETARENLVLKPAGGYASRGVLPGWTTLPAQWRAAVNRVKGQPWVLQERVRAIPERIPRLSPDAVESVDVDVNWGIFGVGGRYNGGMIRGMPTAGADVISTSLGASVGCCFYQRG